MKPKTCAELSKGGGTQYGPFVSGDMGGTSSHPMSAKAAREGLQRIFARRPPMEVETPGGGHSKKRSTEPIDFSVEKRNPLSEPILYVKRISAVPYQGCRTRPALQCRAHHGLMHLNDLPSTISRARKIASGFGSNSFSVPVILQHASSSLSPFSNATP